MRVVMKGFKPREWQERTLLMVKHLEPLQVLTICSGRQRGKSTILSYILIKAALEKAGSESYYISPTNKQSKHFFRNLVKRLPPTLLKTSNAQSLEIELINGSMITLLSGEQGESLRGYTVKKGGYLVYDEAAYLKEQVFEDTKPYVTVSKANIIMCSTPRFESGTFYECYKKGQAGRKGYRTIDWADFDTSEFLPKEAVEQYRQEYPKLKFLTEVLGKFIKMDGSVFTGIEKCIKRSLQPYGKCWMGIDWGTGSEKDDTVVTLINEQREVFFQEAFNNLTPIDQVNHICDIIKLYNPCKITAELNSIGKVYLDLLKKTSHRRIDSFTTTNDTKKKIIDALQIAIANNTISFMEDGDLIMQLSSYQIQKTTTGKITYNGYGAKDDRVMSLAITLESMTLSKTTYAIGWNR